MERLLADRYWAVCSRVVRTKELAVMVSLWQSGLMTSVAGTCQVLVTA